MFAPAEADRYGAPPVFGAVMRVFSARRLIEVQRRKRMSTMAETTVPHFHNTPGVPVIEIGAKEFMCVGELPPLDHPHVFLDMGDDNEIICPYCSTLYRFAADLKAGEARPPECVLKDKVA